MITVLYGHRGVGKTSLLKRISQYISGSQVFCLDQEIEKRHGSLIKIFAESGEATFRDLEIKTFRELYETWKSQTTPVYIAVGGGFYGDLPEDVQRLWVRRDWDTSKEVYLDRPSLHPQSQDPRISLSLFTEREERFRRLAGRQITLLEGPIQANEMERTFFSDGEVGGCMTLLPEHFQQPYWGELIRNLSHLLEIREDLLSPEQIEQAFLEIPPDKILFSFRVCEHHQERERKAAKVRWVDWPVEFAEPPSSLRHNVFISHHTEEDGFYDGLELMEGVEGYAKWSPFVKNFSQLELGHEWMKRGQGQRIFLPRSANGRWYWYRHLNKEHFFIQFWRDAFGSSLDQPTRLQWLQPLAKEGFAAVLGSPVLQSWSPANHLPFFSQREMAIYAIDMSETEIQEGGFGFLEKLGLKACAVTSPLKNWAAELAGVSSACNTLGLKYRQQWEAMNTDDFGFSELLKQAPISLAELKTVIWGGGGVLPSLSVPSSTILYSSRTGQPRAGYVPTEKVDVLIWAAGYQSIDAIPRAWQPQWVIDLNYRPDSPAKLFAWQKKANYLSGEGMFLAQAQKQQELWSSYEWS